MKVSELKNALELVKPGLARKDLLEQATMVAFRSRNLFTFNDEVAVVAPLESGVTGAVLAEPLYKFLGRLPPDGEVSIKVGANEFQFSCGRSRAGVSMDEEVKLPLDEEVPEPEEWDPLPGGFDKALGRVLFSCAQGGHRPILTCVHATEDHLESCDGFRMTRTQCRFDLDNDAPLSLCLVGRNLARLGDYSPTEWALSGNWMQFRNSAGVRYCVRVVEGDYPDLDPFTQVEGRELELPKEVVVEALEWASVMADDSIKYKQEVSISVTKGLLTVKGEGPDGWSERAVRLKYAGEPLQFHTHPTMLSEMLSLGSRITVGKESMKIESDGYLHVVSLNVEG